jgi:hypothetical protein
MAYYKVTINTMESGADATVHADANVQVRISRNPDVFKDVRSGHRTIVLSATEVEIIAKDAVMTNNQKKQALKDLIKAKVLAFGIDAADEAWTDFITFVPPPFEVIVRDV